MKWESENVEFKSQMVDGIYKEIIAFANSDGGTLYIGIDDNGNEIGLENIDDTYTRLTNGIRDSIMPDVTMFIRYELQGNKIIRVEVGEGSYKPYYLKSKGLKPSGVFIRQGASSVQASPDNIRKMIKEADGNVFEEMRTLNQNLTFRDAAIAFEKYKVQFTEDKFIVLGLRTMHEDMYTNLALLLSDQCQHSIKVAVFEDKENTIFKDSKEFTGSILKQLDETFSYLSLCNRKKSVFKGVERIEKNDYPEEVLREALLNAIVHRDYSFSGSVIINVNDEFIEFISLGGLLPGLTEDDIKNGISQPRNKKLADIFHRLRLIESYGTGIRRIYNLYKNYSIQPEIHVTENSFKLILPNMNKASEIILEKTTDTVKSTKKITKQMQTVLDYISEHGEISDRELQQLLNIKQTRTYTLTKQMSEEGLIEIIGKGEERSFSLKK